MPIHTAHQRPIAVDGSPHKKRSFLNSWIWPSANYLSIINQLSLFNPCLRQQSSTNSIGKWSLVNDQLISDQVGSSTMLLFTTQHLLIHHGMLMSTCQPVMLTTAHPPELGFQGSRWPVFQLSLEFLANVSAVRCVADALLTMVCTSWWL